MVDYNPNTPDPNSTLGSSQPIFQKNFQSLFDTFLKNHVSLIGGATAGNHNVIQLLETLSSFQTDFGEFSISTQNVEGQTNQLFMRYQGNGEDFQYTNYQIYKPIDYPWRISYFTFLPGKLLVYFGTFIPSKYPAGFGDPAIVLEPFVSKNIFSFNMSPIGTTTTVNPQITLIKNENANIIRAIGFTQFNKNLDYYYMVVSNI